MKILTEMAYDRNKAIREIKYLADTVGDHLLKCVVYKDSLSCLEDWKEEIAGYLEDAGQITVKKQGKLKPSDYQLYLFGEYADEYSDYKVCIGSFHAYYVVRKERYPKFSLVEDSPEFAKSLMSIHKALADKALPMLSSKSEYSFDDYYKVVDEVLKHENIN